MKTTTKPAPPRPTPRMGGLALRLAIEVLGEHTDVAIAKALDGDRKAAERAQRALAMAVGAAGLKALR